MIHLISKHSSVDLAFSLIKTIPQPELIHGESDHQAQLIITQLYLLSTSDSCSSDKLDQVLASLPTNVDVSSSPFKSCQALLWARGDVFAKQKLWPQAISWFQNAAKLVSSNLQDARNGATLHRKIAYCLMQMEKYQEALEFCSKGFLN